MMFITKLFSVQLATFIFFKIFLVSFFFSSFFYRKFSDYSQVITDIHDLFIKNYGCWRLKVGNLLTGAFVKYVTNGINYIGIL